MSFEEILGLLDKGLTPDQIIELSHAPAPAPDPEPAPQPEPAPAPVPALSPSVIDGLIARIDKLTEAVQAGAVYNAIQQGTQPSAPTAEDVMKTLVFPRGTEPTNN